MNYIPDDFSISTDKSKLDINAIHGFLTTSYWAEGRSREAVEKTIQSSFCFGVYYKDGVQAGFARIITDYVGFAYLADVFILEQFRGIGLSKKLVNYIISHPDLGNVKRWMLGTRDAHGLYSQFGFKTLAYPEIFMELSRRDPGK